MKGVCAGLVYLRPTLNWIRKLPKAVALAIQGRSQGRCKGGARKESEGGTSRSDLSSEVIDSRFVTFSRLSTTVTIQKTKSFRAKSTLQNDGYSEHTFQSIRGRRELKSFSEIVAQGSILFLVDLEISHQR